MYINIMLWRYLNKSEVTKKGKGSACVCSCANHPFFSTSLWRKDSSVTWVILVEDTLILKKIR